MGGGGGGGGNPPVYFTKNKITREKYKRPRPSSCVECHLRFPTTLIGPISTTIIGPFCCSAGGDQSHFSVGSVGYENDRDEQI